jgi:hypothetical protein
MVRLSRRGEGGGRTIRDHPDASLVSLQGMWNFVLCLKAMQHGFTPQYSRCEELLFWLACARIVPIGEKYMVPSSFSIGLEGIVPEDNGVSG